MSKVAICKISLNVFRKTMTSTSLQLGDIYRYVKYEPIERDKYDYSLVGDGVVIFGENSLEEFISGSEIKVSYRYGYTCKGRSPVNGIIPIIPDDIITSNPILKYDCVGTYDGVDYYVIYQEDTPDCSVSVDVRKSHGLVSSVVYAPSTAYSPTGKLISNSFTDKESVQTFMDIKLSEKFVGDNVLEAFIKLNDGKDKHRMWYGCEFLDKDGIEYDISRKYSVMYLEDMSAVIVKNITNDDLSINNILITRLVDGNFVTDTYNEENFADIPRLFVSYVP